MNRAGIFGLHQDLGQTVRPFYRNKNPIFGSRQLVGGCELINSLFTFIYLLRFTDTTGVGEPPRLLVRHLLVMNAIVLQKVQIVPQVD